MKPVIAVPTGTSPEDRRALEADGWLVIVAGSEAKVVHTPDPQGPALDEMAFPPPEVLAAMRTISPIRDRTFDANWAYWEKHKEHAAKNPKAFALDILQGVQHDRAAEA